MRKRRRKKEEKKERKRRKKAGVISLLRNYEFVVKVLAISFLLFYLLLFLFYLLLFLPLFLIQFPSLSVNTKCELFPETSALPSKEFVGDL